MIDLFLKSITRSSLDSNLDKLQKQISSLLNISPIPIVEISLNVPIQRIRNNYKGEIFTSEDEISFRSDSVNIIEFGRANLPNSSMFYGSLSSEYINEIRVVNVLETNREFREKCTVKKRQIFTSGEWITIRPLRVAIFPFYRDAVIYNEEIRFHAQTFEDIISGFSSEQKCIYKKVLQFISYYYSVGNITSHLQYAISAYVSEILIDKYGLDGILYPSVRAKFKAYNVVLKPDSVLEKLRLKNAAMFELFLNREKAFIDNLAYGDILPDFTIGWNYTDRTSEKQLKFLL